MADMRSSKYDFVPEVRVYDPYKELLLQHSGLIRVPFIEEQPPDIPDLAPSSVKDNIPVLGSSTLKKGKKPLRKGRKEPRKGKKKEKY